MDRQRVLAEVGVLWLRARIIRAGIALAVLSALLAALLIISLFVGALLTLGAGVPAGLFVMCMLGLIGALLMFLWDVNLSLTALKIEMPAEGVGAGGANSNSTAVMDRAS